MCDLFIYLFIYLLDIERGCREGGESDGRAGWRREKGARPIGAHIRDRRQQRRRRLAGDS